MEVKKDLNYPIKYAVMPIEEQIGWHTGLNELEREYDVVANIASKCYVIGERKEFLSDGTFWIQYEVVFPFIKKLMTKYKDFVPEIPEYNFYSQCTNSIFVDQLFDCFEEAQAVADQANKKIFSRVVRKLAFSGGFPKKVNVEKEKYQKLLDRYKDIEKKIEQETYDMKVTKVYHFSLDDIIKKVVESSSEFYIKLANALSIEEREYLKQLIENRCCSNCTNSSCRVEHYEKIGLDEFGKPQGSGCLGWNNPELIGKQLILKKTDNTRSV